MLYGMFRNTEGAKQRIANYHPLQLTNKLCVVTLDATRNQP